MVKRALHATVVAFLLSAPSAARADESFPLEVHPTALLRGPRDAPSVVVSIRLLRALDSGESVLLHTANGQTSPVRVARNAPGATLRVPIALPAKAYSVHAEIEVRSERPGGAIRHSSVPVDVPRPDANWVVHLIPGFHYDPVWWNTQANYTELGAQMGSDVGPGHALVGAYLDELRGDKQAIVALHQLPYLKTFVEAQPARAVELRDAIRSGRCALVGGTYNELASTLVGPEVVVRSAVYGMLFQRDVLGGDGRIFWQCDVFGHDPSFPSLMARSGHVAGAFARGPFHQWGAPREHVDMPSEFLWMGPDGEYIPTHYMTGHYGYAYGPLASLAALDSLLPLAARQARWEETLAAMFEDLR